MLVSKPCKFLVDTVFAKGMTVRQSKEELLPQLKEQCKLDLNIDRQDFVTTHLLKKLNKSRCLPNSVCFFQGSSKEKDLEEPRHSVS